MSFMQWCCERGLKSHVAIKLKAKASLFAVCMQRFSFHEFYNFFYLICYFFFVVYSLIFLYFFYACTYDIYPRQFLFHKINILELFSIFFGYLFSMLFFTHDIYPWPMTHDPWPLRTTQDPQHLATLLLISFYFMQ